MDAGPSTQHDALIVGYDPGGNDAHGLAVVEVERKSEVWSVKRVKAEVFSTLDSVMGFLMQTYAYPERTLAAGIDTLTAWNTGPAQWRPADLWLRRRYRQVLSSVQTPAKLNGSMTINGAAFVEWSRRLDPSGNLQITEAHPKVCYYAATGRKHAWQDPDERPRMLEWLGQELGVEVNSLASQSDGDHPFDAAIGALAALRGLNGDWTHDLHAEPSADSRPENLHPFGLTHFWWPE